MYLNNNHRKYLHLIFLLSITLSVNAQITQDKGQFYSKLQGSVLLGIDSLFVYSNSTSPVITFKYNGTSAVEWYKYSPGNPETLVSSSNGAINNEYLLDIDKSYDELGYILKVGGIKRCVFWVINYEKFEPTTSTIFEPNSNQTNQCYEITLGISNFPEMHYYNPAGNKQTISRICTINYPTLNWNGKDWEKRDTIIHDVLLPKSDVSVPAPYCNSNNNSVEFNLVGDQFASDLSIKPWTVKSSEYHSNAVICKLATVVASRKKDKNNESAAPDDKQPIDYSAPIDVQFLSNANEPVAQFYNWTVYKGKELIINRKDKDHRYTFSDHGTYKVKITASNSFCSYSDSITVNVTESDIQVPNVFTPNGDRFNDEFRVAYKSLVSFQCWVYNRWGRLVYTWTDPSKGWDGKINGVDAKPGPYFYVIKAYGSDFDPNSKRNPKSNERTGEYIRKGDINLLRGVH